MGRRWMTGAMLAIAALSVPVLAESGGEPGSEPAAFADCAVDRADATLKRSLAAALINGADDGVVDPLMAQYAALSSACAADWALDDAQRKAYLDYGVMRLMRDWLAGELAGYGLSAATVDTALDFGDGRRNVPLAGEMQEDEVKALVQAFVEAGVDAENLGPTAWEAVGTYAAVSPIFWRKRQQVLAWALIPTQGAAPPASTIVEPSSAGAVPAIETPVQPEPIPPGIAASNGPAPDERRADPAEAAPALPIFLPYEPLPETVDPAPPGGETPVQAEVPPAAPHAAFRSSPGR